VLVCVAVVFGVPCIGSARAAPVVPMQLPVVPVAPVAAMFFVPVRYFCLCPVVGFKALVVGLCGTLRSWKIDVALSSVVAQYACPGDTLGVLGAWLLSGPTPSR
jgi:hypothetical protein